ncbi:diphthine--ammonia ligase [Candidatus Woesearchaeota archaeon]|nr:MAG: diphthine--ammonia ligase [Candidatus Woesearchaeota archaeon]
MRLGVLFSGGKDSTYAAYLAQQHGHELACLITLVSENPDSFMFHTPTIAVTAAQAALMRLPHLQVATRGEEEREIQDLQKALAQAEVDGIVTGAVGSVYQATRIQRVCHELGLHVFNPLWQKDQLELLDELINEGFEVIVSAVAAYPLDKHWVGRRIDEAFIKDVRLLQEQHHINPAGEGGEFETLVINCPLFSKPLVLGETVVRGAGNSFRLEVRNAPH